MLPSAPAPKPMSVSPPASGTMAYSVVRGPSAAPASGASITAAATSSSEDIQP